MLHIETISGIREAVQSARQDGKRIGLVPTMGYLHEGHLALVEAAQQRTDFVVTSIFVNPLQFGPAEDLDKYPRNIDRDIQALRAQKRCDVVFDPAVSEMYPRQMVTQVALPALSRQLCGQSRLTHFQGVATVVSKLFHIVQPDVAFFGQKDGQQLAVIRRMVEDLNFPIEIVGVPTIREADGLAKSSRNVYLSPDERVHAAVLYRALTWAEEEIESRRTVSGQGIAEGVRQRIEADACARLDYVEVVDMDTLEPVDLLQGNVMVAVAAFFGKARLIDNIQIQI